MTDEEMYDMKDLRQELLDQRFNMAPKGVELWVIDYDDVLTAIENLENGLQEMKQSLRNELLKRSIRKNPRKEVVKQLQLVRKILGETGKQ